MVYFSKSMAFASPGLEVRFNILQVKPLILILCSISLFFPLIRCPPHPANPVRERRLATEVWMHQVKLHTRRYAVFTFYLSDFPTTWAKIRKGGFNIHFTLHLCLPQTTSSALKGAIQLGIGYTVGNLSSKPERDVLMQDFYVVESIFFPRSAKCSV